MDRKTFDNLSLSNACSQLMNEGVNEITDYETLKSFAKEAIDNDSFFLAQHICEALADYQADYYFYDYFMGTLETPTPIKSKEDISHLIDD